LSVLQEALLRASANENGLEICNFLVSQGANNIYDAYSDMDIHSNRHHDILKYFGTLLLSQELRDDIKHRLYHNLFKSCFAIDDVEYLKIFLNDESLPILKNFLSRSAKCISRSGNIRCLRFIMDIGIDVTDLRSNSLMIDPSIAYVIDNHQKK
jgi:hypothetical protein